jgi:hypothetical protein
VGVTVLAAEPATRADIIEALQHLRRDCGRMTCADPRYAAKHASIDRLLTALEATP